MLLLIASVTNAQDYNLYDHGSYIHKQDTLHYRILFPEHLPSTAKEHDLT